MKSIGLWSAVHVVGIPIWIVTIPFSNYFLGYTEFVCLSLIPVVAIGKRFRFASRGE